MATLGDNPFALLSDEPNKFGAGPTTTTPSATAAAGSRPAGAGPSRAAGAAGAAAGAPKVPNVPPSRGSTDPHADVSRDTRRPHNAGKNNEHGHGGPLAPRPGKRAFDRHSGTGVPPFPKKGGAGRANWGSKTTAVVDDMVAETEILPAELRADQIAEGAAPGVVGAAGGEGGAEQAGGAASAEAEKKISWDEYKRQHNVNVTAGAAAHRRANEGEDPKKWQGYKTLERETEHRGHHGAGRGKKGETPAVSVAQSHVDRGLDVGGLGGGARSSAPGGGAGRGGFRGGPGGGRGGRGQQRPDIQDNRAFPALGTA